MALSCPKCPSSSYFAPGPSRHHRSMASSSISSIQSPARRYFVKRSAFGSACSRHWNVVYMREGRFLLLFLAPFFSHQSVGFVVCLLILIHFVSGIVKKFGFFWCLVVFFFNDL